MTLLERLRDRGLEFSLKDDGRMMACYPAHPSAEQIRFIEAHEHELTAELLREDVKKLEATNRVLTERLEKADLEFTTLMRMWAAEKLKNKPQPSLSDDLIRKARVLTHPDRHEGSEVANEVTAALNRLIKERRAQP